MVEKYRVYKVDGKIIGNFITLDEARIVASKHRGARIATRALDTKEWSYSAVQGKLF
jgi:hypothetical protein